MKKKSIIDRIFKKNISRTLHAQWIDEIPMSSLLLQKHKIARSLYSRRSTWTKRRTHKRGTRENTVARDRDNCYFNNITMRTRLRTTCKSDNDDRERMGLLSLYRENKYMPDNPLSGARNLSPLLLQRGARGQLFD